MNVYESLSKSYETISGAKDVNDMIKGDMDLDRSIAILSVGVVRMPISTSALKKVVVSQTLNFLMLSNLQKLLNTQIRVASITH